jgi:hypothetical protein
MSVTDAKPSQTAPIMLLLAIVSLSFEPAVKMLPARFFWTKLGNIEQKDRDQSLRIVQQEDGGDIVVCMIEPPSEEIDDCKDRQIGDAQDDSTESKPTLFFLYVVQIKLTAFAPSD